MEALEICSTSYLGFSQTLLSLLPHRRDENCGSGEAVDLGLLPRYDSVLLVQGTTHPHLQLLL
ncbi:hypothetical protein JZ751_014253 [Albula glossodonta]|uniref:Uncharacterized protein n=1 Tax=Albula glossodonta TaxID=121402 RepID=A0A8T2P0V2_9TELE|nr:hypothetical protein JZ751_014253 [Albula glossodonta]